MFTKQLMTVLAGAAVFAASLTGVATTTAPLANAAAKYSAVVYSPSTGAWGWSMLAGKQQQAVDVAMTYCAGAGGSDCQMAAASTAGGCVALARSKDGVKWHGGAGPSSAEAQGNAYAPIGGGDLLVSTCSGTDGEPADPKGAGGVSALPIAAPAPAPPPAAPAPAPKKAAPTNAVTMNIQISGVNADINIASSADIPGTCTYKATAPLLPAVNKTFDLAPNGSMSFSTLAPPLLSTYHVVLSCKGVFDGKSVEFGHVEQDVTTAG
jgi:Domain of unknown function (DUF4189)